MQHIYLHGWGFDREVFRLLDEALDNECPCLYSLTSEGSYTAISEAISERCVEETVLVGWSMGGQIAIDVAARQQNVIGLVLLASAPILVNKDECLWGINRLDYSELYELFRNKPDKAISQLLALTALGEKDYGAVHKQLHRHIAKPVYNKKLFTLLAELAQTDLRKQFAELSIPVCICVGKNDALLNTALLEQLASKTVQLLVLDETGHAPFVSNADALSSKIKTFSAFVS